MRIIDIMLAFPNIMLALVIVAILGPSIRNVMIAVGIMMVSAEAISDFEDSQSAELVH